MQAGPWTSAGVNAGARLDRLPFGSFHRRLMALVGLGMFLDACDIYLAGGVLGSLVASGWSTLDANAWFMSATFAGMFVGTLSAGYLGDRFGRRFSYQLNLLIFGLASIAAAAAPNMTVLIAIRFVMGAGLGAEIVVGYASMAEFMPRARRGATIALLSVITNCAVPFVGIFGAWLIPEVGWRALFAAIGVGALVVWFLRKAMPESPRWLESQGRVAEAEAQLAAIEAEAARTAPLPPVQDSFAVPPETGRYSELFRAALLPGTILAIIISIVSGISLYGFLSWIPSFLVKQGFAMRSSLWVAALMGLGAPLGGVVGALIADRFGRKRSLIAIALAEAVVGVAYTQVTTGAEMVACGFVLTACAYALVAIGFALYTPEMFPTRLRLRGVSIANGAGRLTSSGVGFIIVAVFGAFGISGVAIFLVGSLLVLAAAILLLGRETSGRALEAIEPAAPPAPALTATRPLAGQ